MKETKTRHALSLVIGTIFYLVCTTVSLLAQTAPEAADAGQKRLKRARALIAAHRLGAAAAELDVIRTETTDDAVRDVARIMLMSVYLEEGNYMRAQALLEETYKIRSAQNENSTRTYFALAGQSVNSAREHLARYRSFGVNITDKELPHEAASDLDHVRMLLDRIAEQARELIAQNEKGLDALGLLEEVATVRATLTRTKQERLQWQREIAEVREKLSASEMRIASAGNLPVNNLSLSSSPGANNSAAASSQAAAPNHTTDTSMRKTTAAAVPDKSEAAPAVKANTPASAPAAGSPAPNGRPVEVGSLIERATQRVNPSYPSVAKTTRITGVVKVYLEIDEKGEVVSVQRTDGPQMLRQAATDAARRWKFRPTIIGGQPVRVMGFINFNFTL